MILSDSITLDDDILDAVFTNEVDDDDDFIFNDLFLFLGLLLLSILATTKTSLYLSISICQFACRNKALLIYHVSCTL
jgi:hypothetical protein